MLHESFAFKVRETLQELEKKCIDDTEEFLSKCTNDNLHEMKNLFNDVVETEMKFYNWSKPKN